MKTRSDEPTEMRFSKSLSEVDQSRIASGLQRAFDRPRVAKTRPPRRFCQANRSAPVSAELAFCGCSLVLCTSAGRTAAALPSRP